MWQQTKQIQRVRLLICCCNLICFFPIHSLFYLFFLSFWMFLSINVSQNWHLFLYKWNKPLMIKLIRFGQFLGIVGSNSKSLKDFLPVLSKKELQLFDPLWYIFFYILLQKLQIFLINSENNDQENKIVFDSHGGKLACSLVSISSSCHLLSSEFWEVNSHSVFLVWPPSLRHHGHRAVAVAGRP